MLARSPQTGLARKRQVCESPNSGGRALLIELVCGEAFRGDKGIVKADLAGVVVVL